MRTLPLMIALAAALSSVGCAGHRKKTVADEPTGIKVHDDYYVANKSLKKFAAGETSSMQKKVFDANKAFGGSTKFHTQNYAGTKAYSGMKDYKAKDFTQTSKKVSGLDKAFSGAGEKSKLADKSFATKDSRFASMTSREGTKSYREAGSEFKTKEDAVATKAVKKNKQVVITGHDEPMTEDGLKRLLNKQ